MKCNHCLISFHDQETLVFLGKDAEGAWAASIFNCPTCGKMNVFLVRGNWVATASRFTERNHSELIRPKGTNRAPCPPEVPDTLCQDYTEACKVLSDSPKASAALSRRCLQSLLRTAGNVKPGNLADEIQEVIDSGKLPSHLTEIIDAVRNIGNFAAHPIKSKHSGEIFDVEPEEAEWNLDVLEALFDFYYVQPANVAKKRDALNAKLQEAGKQSMK